MNTNLDEKELEVLILRKGLNGQKPTKLAKVAKKFGVTQERIIQIEDRAFKKLKLLFNKLKKERSL